MRVIEQDNNTWNLKIDCDESYFKGSWYLDLSQGKDNIKVTKQGAKQLIEVLKEFVEND